MKDEIKKEIRHRLVIITHHPPTKTNQLGQSGFHTLTDDIVDIFEDVILNEKESQLKTILEDFFTKSGNSKTFFPMLKHLSNYLKGKGEFDTFIQEIVTLFKEVEYDTPEFMTRKVCRFIIPLE